LIVDGAKTPNSIFLGDQSAISEENIWDFGPPFHWSYVRDRYPRNKSGKTPADTSEQCAEVLLSHEPMIDTEEWQAAYVLAELIPACVWTLSTHTDSESAVDATADLIAKALSGSYSPEIKVDLILSLLHLGDYYADLIQNTMRQMYANIPGYQESFFRALGRNAKLFERYYPALYAILEPFANSKVVHLPPDDEKLPKIQRSDLERLRLALGAKTQSLLSETMRRQPLARKEIVEILRRYNQLGEEVDSVLNYPPEDFDQAYREILLQVIEVQRHAMGIWLAKASFMSSNPQYQWLRNAALEVFGYNKNSFQIPDFSDASSAELNLLFQRIREKLDPQMIEASEADQASAQQLTTYLMQRAEIPAFPITDKQANALRFAMIMAIGKCNGIDDMLHNFLFIEGDDKHHLSHLRRISRRDGGLLIQNPLIGKVLEIFDNGSHGKRTAIHFLHNNGAFNHSFRDLVGDETIELLYRMVGDTIDHPTAKGVKRVRIKR